jgi:hypothetical protein
MRKALNGKPGVAVEIGDRPSKLVKSIMAGGYTRGEFVVGTFPGRDGSALWRYGIRKQSNSDLLPWM